MMVRASLLLAICVSLLAISGAYAAVEVNANLHQSIDCSSPSVGAYVLTNGTCSLLPGTPISSNVSCDDNGTPSGFLCNSEECLGDCVELVANSSITFDEPACVFVGSASISFSCSEVSPSSPTAEVPESPVAAPVPVTPSPATTPASVPVGSPVDGALITSGNLTIQLYFTNGCAGGAAATASVFSNFSRCQPYSYLGQSYFFRADCYITSYSKVSACTSSDCTTGCTDIPSAASGACSAADPSFNPIRSAKVTCPAYVAPTAGPTSSPSNPTSTPTPSGDAHSIFASFIFVFVAIAAVAFF